MAAKTKSVGGKAYPASDWLYVGDPNDISTWHLCVADAGHIRDAMARFNQTKGIPADEKGKYARKLVGLAKRHGIDASHFASEYAKSKQVLAARAQEAVDEPLAVYERAKLQGGSEDGSSWPIVVMEAGFAKGEVMTDNPEFQRLPHYFPQEVVAQVAESCSRARFGRRHPETVVDETDPARIAGWLDGGAMDGKSARATMHLYENEEGLRGKLLAAKKSNTLDLFGASILAYFHWRKDKAEGRDALVATKLGRLVSVDLVTEAGAGGKILPYAAYLKHEIAAAKAAAESGAARKGAMMKEQILKVLEALRKRDAGRADGLKMKFDGLPEDKYADFWVEVSEALIASAEIDGGKPGDVRRLSDGGYGFYSDSGRAPSGRTARAADGSGGGDGGDGGGDGDGEDEDQPGAPGAAKLLAKANEALEKMQRIESRNLMESKLADSKLPVPAMALVREHLNERIADGAVLDEAKVDAEIKKVRESFAAFSNVGRINGSTVHVGRDTQDKLQLAMDAMFGVRQALADKSVKRFRGIREAYNEITGDRELERISTGGFFMKAQEAWATTDFPNVLLNALTKKLIQDWTETNYQYLEKIYTKAVVGDFKTQDRVRMGYLPALSSVAEAGPFVEIAKPTDELIQYTVAKYGNLLTVSEETIRNDDLGKMMQIPSRMARAGRATLAQYITNFFNNNPNYQPDAVAWFAAAHNNIAIAALSSAALDAAQQALQQQTEKNSLLPLNFRLDWLMVPPALYPSARQINRNPTGTNNWYQRFGENDENIFVNPFLTDVDDWYAGAFPDQAPILEMGFLDGFDMPQIFLANLPTQGTMFTNDQLQYKVKFVFAGNILDFRPVYGGRQD